ncbi:sorting nexin-27-like isoform X2 [Actinia tenebrosa]|uniref:Sorting nexin-27-like isoform X2 n=1 Tax=Actinia tenebrosa TaxID=6105 RepID=A0A6P8J3E5_ACTTE|nr:sorting nexin-27-like isoform X2 [Actinia tenebrosa]
MADEEDDSKMTAGKDQIMCEPRIIELNKGTNGFGFNVRGQVSEGGQLKSINGELYAPLQHVSAVVEGGPAHKGGVRVFDRILEVNGENVEGATHKHVVELIKKGGSHLKLVVISVSQSESEKLDSDSSSGAEYYDYSDRRVAPIAVPETRQVQCGGESYVVYNIYYNNRHICSKRYKEFSNLHTQLRREFRDFQFPKFPGKWPFHLTEQQLEGRRKGLENYMQQVCSVRVIGDSEYMQEFFEENTKKEDDSGMEVELRIMLPDNTTVIVAVQKKYKTREVYKALIKKLGLRDENAINFALFEIMDNGVERKLRRNEFPHSLYIRRYTETSDTCLTIRKWIFTLSREVAMDSDEVALNLLYHQAAEDLRTRKVKVGNKLQKLKELKDTAKNLEYLNIARTLEGYGTVTFPHCPCDARKTGHVIVAISIKNFQMNACTDQGEIEAQQHILEWKEITQFDSDTEAMAFCFEYAKGGKTRWVKIYSEFYEYMTECVQRVMQEIEWNENDGISPDVAVLPEEYKATEQPKEEATIKHNKPPSPSRTRAKSGKSTKSLPTKQTEVFSGAIEDDDL